MSGVGWSSAWLLVALLLVVRLSSAHAIGLSRGEYHASTDGLEARFVFDRDELAGVLGRDGGAGLADAQRPGSLALTSERGRAELERRIVQQVRVLDGDGQRCPGALEQLGSTNDGGLFIEAAYHCQGKPDVQQVVVEFWDELSPGHRRLATSASAGATPSGAREQLLYRTQPRLELAALPRSPRLSSLDWIRLGVEHILGGYDHLLFLLALVLVTPALRTLTATVSVFTLAHSVTLALSTLRLFTPPPGLVECAIALSITYVGLENLTARANRSRFNVVFAFGLIHGFGFAGALAELGLPQAKAPGALLAFNAGVELGQLAVLALAFPIIQQLRRTTWFGPRGVPALSLGTALAGVFWFCERV